MTSLLTLVLLCTAVWWFFKRKKSTQNETDRPDPILIDAKHHAYVRPNSPNENRIALLHREATEHKSNKDWARAIACLREAETLKPQVPTSYPIAHYVRLPLFLQQAGEFEEAMREFQTLIDTTEARVLGWLPKRNIASKTMLVHADYFVIYKAMSTASKREKHIEQAEEYLELAKEHKLKHAKLFKAQQARDAKKVAERKK